MSQSKKVISTLITVFVMSLTLVSSANAGVNQIICTASSNNIQVLTNGVLSHHWVYVNSTYRGDFWSVSGSTETFITSVANGDHVMILSHDPGSGYGQAHGYCS